MQSIKNSILQHLRFSVSSRQLLLIQRENVLEKLGKLICTSSGATQDQILDKVIALVKRYDNINASKVTETADFKKDLSLDSLDRVELIMALEEEFSVEIPDEKADKLTCCADIAKYIASETKPNNSDSPSSGLE